jgi:twitching motility protein PilT
MQLNQQQTGMQTQTKELQKLLMNRVITKEVALKYSNRPEELLNFIKHL